MTTNSKEYMRNYQRARRQQRKNDFYARKITGKTYNDYLKEKGLKLEYDDNFGVYFAKKVDKSFF